MFKQIIVSSEQTANLSNKNLIKSELNYWDETHSPINIFIWYPTSELLLRLSRCCSPFFEIIVISFALLDQNVTYPDGLFKGAGSWKFLSSASGGDCYLVLHWPVLHRWCIQCPLSTLCHPPYLQRDVVGLFYTLAPLGKYSISKNMQDLIFINISWP